MNVRSWLLNRLGGAPAAPRQSAMMRPSRRRNFDSAAVSRLTSTWSTMPQAPDQVIRNNLRSLRARSREQFRNNDVPYLMKWTSL